MVLLFRRGVTTCMGWLVDLSRVAGRKITFAVEMSLTLYTSLEVETILGDHLEKLNILNEFIDSI